MILVEYIRLLVILIKNKIKKIKLQLANLSVQNNDDDNNNNNNNNNNNKIEKYCLIFYRYTLWNTKMKTYCLKFKKDTENIDPKNRTKNNRLLMQSTCGDCEIKSHNL